MIKLYLKAKISLFSRYERVTDRRTLAQRRDLFESPKVEEPKKKKEIDVPKKKADAEAVEEE